MIGLAGGDETSIYFSRVSLFAAAVLSLALLVILSLAVRKRSLSILCKK